MKTHTLLRYFLTAANLAAALALLPPHARAEDKPPSRPNKPSASAESKSSGYDLEIVAGQFAQKGKKELISAYLGDVVDALRDRYPKANIVLSPGLETLIVSDMKLRSASLREYLDAIRVASGGKFEWTGPGGGGSGGDRIDPTTGLPVATVRPDSNEGLFVLHNPTPTPETARTVEAFNIGPYLQWLREKHAEQTPENREKEVKERLDELEQIVQVTLIKLKQGPSVELPSFQFHRGANLLIVTGTRDAVEVARKVVSALPGQPGSANAESYRAPGMSPEDRRRFQERYGLRPSVPSPVPGAPAAVPPK